jgi:hypothetical protein
MSPSLHHAVSVLKSTGHGSQRGFSDDQPVAYEERAEGKLCENVGRVVQG